MKSLCYYVTAHGFGHSVRAIEIVRALSEHTPVIVKSRSAEWFWRQELDRPFDWVADAFDVGAVQTDSLSADAVATLHRYAEVHHANQARLDDEARWLDEHDVGLVVSDVPSFPLRVAYQVGIPGLIVANFTWLEIYRSYVDAAPELAWVLGALAEEYRLASLALFTPLRVEMPQFPFAREVPLVARKGRPTRGELSEALGVDPLARLVLLYRGTWGMDLPWDRLSRLRDVTFLSFSPPDGAPGVVPIPQGRWRHQDVCASVDAVLAKPGYGIVSECMTNGTPLIYPMRDHFVEFDALHEGIEHWGGGILIDRNDFLELNWQPYLDRLTHATPPSPWPINGAHYCARLMENYLH